MSNHVTEWLNAYFDGELHGSRLHQVEAHLVECLTCQAELDALQSLSEELHAVPLPEFTPPERFAVRVNLVLPQKPVQAPHSRLFEVGWWLIPVGVLAAWGFVSTAILVTNLVVTANGFGLLDSTSAFFVSGSSEASHWAGSLGQLGLVNGSGLQWFELTESYSRNLLPALVWQAGLALLYLAWMAVWWARHTRLTAAPLLES